MGLCGFVSGMLCGWFVWLITLIVLVFSGSLIVLVLCLLFIVL